MNSSYPQEVHRLVEEPGHGESRVLATQLCPSLCDHTDSSLPGSSVHGSLQARILEWVAISTSVDGPDPGIETAPLVSLALAGKYLTISTT